MADAHETPAESGSIETVLSSIRRILQDGKGQDEPAATADASATAPVVDDEDEDSVLVLDSSMIAADEDEAEPELQGADPVAHEEPVVAPTDEAKASESQNSEPANEAPASATAETSESHQEQKDSETAGKTGSSDEVAGVDAAAVTSSVFAAAADKSSSKADEKGVSSDVALSSAGNSPHEGKTVAETPKQWQATQSGGLMSEENKTPAETQGFAQGYGASATASEVDAPTPVAIALDKQTIGATEHSFGALQQMLRRKQANEHKERRVAITRGGNLTIEDIVRDEVRAFLKEWLDSHLSSIVQQAVQKEIERLSDR